MPFEADAVAAEQRSNHDEPAKAPAAVPTTATTRGVVVIPL